MKNQGNKTVQTGPQRPREKGESLEGRGKKEPEGTQDDVAEVQETTCDDSRTSHLDNSVEHLFWAATPALQMSCNYHAVFSGF